MYGRLMAGLAPHTVAGVTTLDRFAHRPRPRSHERSKD